jgi:hypothetical protein
MQPVDSSWIESLGHDPTSNEMHMRTKDGRTYRYLDTTAAEHKALLNAKSAGAHFNAHIRHKKDYEELKDAAD